MDRVYTCLFLYIRKVKLFLIQVNYKSVEKNQNYLYNHLRIGDTMNYKEIGLFISKKRKELNMTQKELANKLNVTDKAVSKWERGLGCPDISILEVLSNILGVSILELLKGRNIQGEVIPVLEADDYLKNTINYSQKSLNKKIVDLLTIIIIGIASFIVIININHIIYLNKEYEYNFSNNEILEDINKIKNNINKIKNTNNIFDNTDYKNLNELLNSYYNKIINNSILKFNGIKKFKLRDLNQLDNELPGFLEILSSYKILEKYDSKQIEYEELLSILLASKTFNLTFMYNEPLLSYKYQFLDSSDTFYTDKVTPRIIEFKYRVKEFLYLTNKIIEVGEYYE